MGRGKSCLQACYLEPVVCATNLLMCSTSINISLLIWMMMLCACHEGFCTMELFFNKNEIFRQELVQYIFLIVVLHMIGLSSRK